MKIVVVSPHHDDAAFSIGLAIGTWLTAGHAVHVVNCFTRSKYAPFADSALLHPHDQLSHVTALRSREASAWRQHNGKGLTFTDMNLKDAPIRLRCSIGDVCSLQPVPGDKATLKIQKLLHGLQAEALALPLCIGNHVDHLCARDAAIAQIDAALPCVFYEDMPYSARPGASETIEASARILNKRLSPVFAADALSAQTDMQAASKRKQQLVLCYDSQIDDETTQQIAQFCLHYDGRERLWANDGWRASHLMIDPTRRQMLSK